MINIGCAVKGVYGEGCSIPCPENCQEANCHILDGTCLGCTEGYIGLRCSEGTN